MKRLAVLGLLLALAPAAQGGVLAPVHQAVASAGISLPIGPLPDPDAPELEPDPDESASCGGTAPVQSSCDTSLSGQEGQTITIWVVLGTPFSGSVEARVTDTAGNSASVTCTTVLYASGVTPFPDCTVRPGSLRAGTLTLHGEATGVSAGFWEVHAQTT